MKFACIILVAVLAAAVKAGDPEMMMKVMQDCKAKVGASDEDLGKIMLHAPLVSQPQMCMFSCMMDALGIVKDGKLQKDGLMELSKKITGGDADKMAAAAELFDECSGMSGADACESAAKIGMCLKENGEKKKVMFGM